MAKSVIARTAVSVIPGLNPLFSPEMWCFLYTCIWGCKVYPDLGAWGVVGNTGLNVYESGYRKTYTLKFLLCIDLVFRCLAVIKNLKEKRGEFMEADVIAKSVVKSVFLYAQN
jgi:hypothetical protein